MTGWILRDGKENEDEVAKTFYLLTLCVGSESQFSNVSRSNEKGNAGLIERLLKILICYRPMFWLDKIIVYHFLGNVLDRNVKKNIKQMLVKAKFYVCCKIFFACKLVETCYIENRKLYFSSRNEFGWLYI